MIAASGLFIVLAHLGVAAPSPGSDELWRHLSDVQVEGAEAVREDGPAERIIAHSPGAALTVRYRVRCATACG